MTDETAPDAGRDDAAYRHFWEVVGDDFPLLTGAPSTDLYFEGESRLLRESLPSFVGLRILKTDLWDEAKNTRILQWIGRQGAHVYGIDVSGPIVRQACAAFDGHPVYAAVADVRELPFADGAFDAIYSMGTVEHFPETEASVRELARVLAPHGRLILGVPNRCDPFLRPALVWGLSLFGLYGYGAERSYSRAGLRQLLEQAGLEVVSESGVLFVPGWLRMADLLCHTRRLPLARLMRALVAPFTWLERHVPRVRRHGYLIAAVGVKRHCPRR
jgi:SAM-dependent methyltransferase